MKTLIALSAALFATAAQAQTVFSDDFNANALSLSSTPAGWTVSNGTVDVIGPGLFGELCAGTGTCIDLDGSTGQSGVLSHSLTLNAGTTYTLSFDLAGNRRGAGTETGTVSFGSASLGYTLADSQVAYQNYTLSFTPLTSGSYAISFANAGGDNMGAILDNVSVSAAVPEPASFAMLLLGLGGVALLKRRRA